MNRLIQFIKIWKKSAVIALQDAMAYKLSFFLQMFGLFIGDTIIPLVSALIYKVSSGIPGWSLYEFVLFQGTLIIVIGFWHTLFAGLLGETIVAVKEGTFDKFLLKPLSSLAYVTSKGFDLEGIGEILAGIAVVTFALIKLKLFSLLLLPYLFLIILGILFEYALTIIAASLAFIFVKTWRLFEFISSIERFGRYPLGIYNDFLRIMLTFFIPVAAASYYPASVLLEKEVLLKIPLITIPVIIFFTVSIFLWNFAMKKYSSAGG